MGLFDFFRSVNYKPSIDLKDFKFLSDDHTRIENGRIINSNNKGAWRGIRVKTSDNSTFSVTIYNMNENHPVWGDNIQMAEKKMKLVAEQDDKIILRGFGTDAMGASFSDYGLTLHKSNGSVNRIILHMHDRNIDIEYLKSQDNISEEKSTHKYDFEQMRIQFMKGVEAINEQDYSEAIVAFNTTLNILKDINYTDNDTISSCYYNLGESYKETKRYEEAISAFSSAIEVRPDNEDAYLGLSVCYFSLDTNDGLQRSLDILSKCIIRFPNNEIAHLNKGSALFKLNRYSEAYASYKRASELGSHEANLYLEIVKIYIS